MGTVANNTVERHEHLRNWWLRQQAGKCVEETI